MSANGTFPVPVGSPVARRMEALEWLVRQFSGRGEGAIVLHEFIEPVAFCSWSTGGSDDLAEVNPDAAAVLAEFGVANLYRADASRSAGSPSAGTERGAET